MKTNIIKFEISKCFKQTVIYTTILVVILALYLFGLYPSFKASQDDLKPLLENFPDAFLDAFGMSIDSFFSYIGIITFAYVYIGVIGSIMAVYIGLSIFSRETKSKCLDFIITKPIKRKDLFTSKLLASYILIASSSLIFIIFSILFYLIGGSGEFGLYILLIIIIPTSQLVFLSIGIFLGVFLNKVKNVSGISVCVGILGFLISALQGMTKLDILRFISPLQYLSLNYISKYKKLEVGYLILFIVVFIFLQVIAYFKYIKKEFL